MARNGDESSNQLDEQSKMVLRVRELFRGRFTIEEIEKLLHLHEYEQGPTVFYILSSDTQEIRKVLTDSTNVVDRLTYVRNDDKLVEDAKRNLIGFTVRQFTCFKCDRMWWWKAPKRKPVSRCKSCQAKYDPVPEEVEFGWGEFLCRNCGNIFKGHGQKTTTRSECYHCHSLCFPVKIEPPVMKPKVRGRGSRNFHSCDAPDCYNQISGNSKEKHVRGPSGLVKKCVHPISKNGDRKFSTYFPCELHTSTGSTVETFLSQDFLSYSQSDYSQSLETINEDLDATLAKSTDRFSVEEKGGSLDKRLREAGAAGADVATGAGGTVTNGGSSSSAASSSLSTSTTLPSKSKTSSTLLSSCPSLSAKSLKTANSSSRNPKEGSSSVVDKVPLKKDLVIKDDENKKEGVEIKEKEAADGAPN